MRIEEKLALYTVHDGVSFGISATLGKKRFIFARIYDQHWDHYHSWITLYENIHGVDAEKEIRIYARSFPKHMSQGITEHG